jgi:hypothetical protein
MFRWISRLWCRHDDRQTFQQDGLWAGARVKVQCRKCGRITTHLMVLDDASDEPPLAILLNHFGKAGIVEMPAGAREALRWKEPATRP